jgi:hypothetical protein
MTSVDFEFPVLYFTDDWVREDLTPKNASSRSLGQYLVMTQDESVFRLIQASLKDGERAIFVRLGPGFRVVDDHTFDINSSDYQNYVALIDAMKEKGISINRIVFHWPHLAQEQGFLPLLLLSQALVGTKCRDPIQLIYLNFENNEKELPYQRASAGFMRSLRAEYPHLIFKYLETENCEFSDLANLILNEFCSDSKFSVEVTISAGLRSIRQLKPVEWNVVGQKSQRLRMNGVYVITGGSGGLGLILAEFLRTKFDAKVILLGRKPEFSVADPSITYLQCDVTKGTDVVRVRDKIIGLFGRVSGIIHAAGAMQNNRILQKTPGEIRAVLSPKVDGLNHIFDAFQHCDLDFLLLFSSISSVLGTVGLCDYAFANAYLDSFAKIHSSRSSIQKLIAVDWPLWECGGMQADERTKRILFFMSGMVPLTKQAGLIAFEEALSFTDTQLIVAQGDSERLHVALGITKSS